MSSFEWITKITYKYIYPESFRSKYIGFVLYFKVKTLFKISIFSKNIFSRGGCRIFYCSRPPTLVRMRGTARKSMVIRLYRPANDKLGLPMY